MSLASADLQSRPVGEQQAIIRSKLGVAEKPTVAPLTPEQAKQKANVDAVSAEMVKGNAQKALELRAGRNKFTRSSEAEKTIILSGKDADGNPIEGVPGERIKLQEIQNQTQVFEEFVSHGIDGLKPDLRRGGLSVDQKKALLVAPMREMISKMPPLQEALSDANGNIEPDAVLAQLKNPQFVKLFAEHMSTIYKQDYQGEIGSLDTKYLDARTRHEVASEEATRVGGIKTAQGAEQSKYQAEKTKFENDHLPGTGLTKEATLNNLTTHPDVARYKQAEQIFANISKTGNAHAMDTAYSELVRLRTPNVDQFETLSQEKAQITGKLESTSAEIQKANAELIKQKGEVAKAKTEMDSLTLERKTLQDEFIDSVQHAVEDTANQYLTDEVKELIAKYPEYQTNVDTALKAEADAKINEESNKRYLTRDKKGTRLDKTKTAQDMMLITDVVINPNGDPNKFMEKVMTDAGLDPTQIATLMADQGFVDAQRANMVGKLLAAHGGAGGKIDDQMQSMLTHTEWGKKASVEWLNSDSQAKEFVQKITGKAVSKDSLQEIIKKKGNKAGFVALLLGLGLAIVVGEEAGKMTA